MPGSPSAIFGLSDVDGTDEGFTLEDRINEINAALEGLGVGFELRGLKAAQSGGVSLDLRDTGAGANVKRFRILTVAGVTYLQAVNDAYSAVTHTFATLNHTTGEVVLTPEAEIVVDSGGSAPPLENSWSDSLPVTFYRHAGRVWLSGFVNHAPASNATIFTLPAGYRPSTNHVFYLPSVGGPYQLEANMDGTVKPSVGFAVNSVSFDGLSFRHA